MEPAVSPSRRRSASTRRRAAGPLIALVTIVLTVVALEVGFRLADFDFEFKARAFARLPIFCRQPVVPVGPAFFRRPGPDRWQGQVLRMCDQLTGAADDAYRDEPAVTVTYDREGFRNPPELSDWDVVVTGDSFTELGYLPYEDLFTSRLADLRNVRVKNLGVSYTGTITQTSYLREYGKAPSTTDAIVVFFEGNDLLDIVVEHLALEGSRRGETRPVPRSRLETLPKQSSLLKAAYRLLVGERPAAPAGDEPAERLKNYTPAVFVSGATRTPLTVDYLLPNRSDLPAAGQSLVMEAIAGWGDAARALGLRPWLAYMPCKRRVLDGYLTSVDGTPLPVMHSDLPDFVRDAAARVDIRFVDLTPALRRETERGGLTYNAIRDTHLNRLGSWTVGNALARALARDVGRRGTPDSR